MRSLGWSLAAAKEEEARLGISLAELLRRSLRRVLADAVGLHRMSVRKTRSCWSTDRHLRLTGIPLVIDHA